MAAKRMHDAQNAYQKRDYDGAIKLYRFVLDAVPSSKAARIGAAEVMFSNNDKSDDDDAMTLLSGISLDQGAWSRIEKVMPVKYQQYFHEVKQ